MGVDSFDARYRAVQSRDPRFDGVFYTGVRTTGIYCRPSCPAMTPKPGNVSFYPSPAAAQAAGLRACRRCLPDATPGSPEWDVRADVADRAMRLIADGVVEREGVEGLATRLGYSVRQLNRLVTHRFGAGPLALARSRRAQTARVLIDSTSMPLTDVAFAAGFSSVRQFNHTMQEVYAASPSQLRQRRPSRFAPPGRVSARIAVREPFARQELLAFLERRALAGVESVDGLTYQRTLALPHGAGRIVLDFSPAKHVGATFELTDVRDLAPALERCRRLLDADCDPQAVDEVLGKGPLRAAVRATPGLRVPGHVDGFELAVRAIVGQQVSVVAARRLAEHLVDQWGTDSGFGRLFPSADSLAGADLTIMPMPKARARTISALAQAVASGEVALDRSADRNELRERLLAVPGIGPWTCDYIAMRALGDPDVLLVGDAGTRHGALALGVDVLHMQEAWRPWRSYAQMHVWEAA